jgi:hypothetical protein
LEASEDLLLSDVVGKSELLSPGPLLYAAKLKKDITHFWRWNPGSHFLVAIETRLPDEASYASVHQP